MRENLLRILFKKLLFLQNIHIWEYGNTEYRKTDLSLLHVNDREFKFQHFNLVLF